MHSGGHVVWQGAGHPQLSSVYPVNSEYLFSSLSCSSNSPALASQVAGTTGIRHQFQLIFVFLVETEFHHVGQAGLKLLISGDLLASASQSAEITGVSHCARPPLLSNCSNFHSFPESRVSLCHPGWNAVMQSQLNATSAFRVQVILCFSLPRKNQQQNQNNLKIEKKYPFLSKEEEVFQAEETAYAKALRLEQAWYSLTPLPMLECSGTIIAYCHLNFLGSSNPPASASQASLKLQSSSDPSALAFQSAGMMAVSHCTWSRETSNGPYNMLGIQPTELGGCDDEEITILTVSQLNSGDRTQIHLYDEPWKVPQG
ncbi:hypothetical protein AAY473_020405 [Plecturocebus cupreus]